MPSTRVVLLHGAATTPAVWARLTPLLDPPRSGTLEVIPAKRPSSGDLDREVDALADVVRDAVVVGVSGGATLGLALLAAGVPLAGGVLHEPAVGTLAPGLLDHIIAGYAAGGVPGFGRALYGPSWSPDMAPDDEGAVERDLRMFRNFEPSPLAVDLSGRVVVTVGGDSPALRYDAATALEQRCGLPRRELPRCRHFVQWDNPDALAQVVAEVVAAIR